MAHKNAGKAGGKARINEFEVSITLAIINFVIEIVQKAFVVQFLN